MSSFETLRNKRQARQAPRRGVGVPVGEESVTASNKVVEERTPASDGAEASTAEAALDTKMAAVQLERPAGRLESEAELKATTGSIEVASSWTDPAASALFAAELANTPLQVRATSQHGRGLYAKQAIAAGSIIAKTLPVTAVLARPSTNISDHCSACFQPRKVSRCAACKATFYCSSVCQKADWPSHKSECAALKRLRGMWAKMHVDKAKSGSLEWVPDEAARAMARLCWARKSFRDANGRDPDWWAKVAAMESHTKGMDENEGMRLGRQVQHLLHYLGAAVPSSDPDMLHPVDMAEFGFTRAGELLDVCSAFGLNSFTLASADMSSIGVATSPFFALFNHSCWPNAVIVFPKGGKEMCAVAIQDIQAGDEVLTSYIDVSSPYADRQCELEERYGFACDCGLCAKNADSAFFDPRWSLIHPGCKANGSGRMPDLRHSGDATVRCACGETFTVAVPPLRQMVNEAKDLIVQDAQGRLDRDEALRTLATLLPRLAELMPPSSYPLLPLLRLHALQLTPPNSPTERDAAVASLTAAAVGARAAHPPNHPTVGIIMATRAKLLAYDPEYGGQVSLSTAGRDARVAQLVAAVRALREAATACDLGNAPGGDVARDLRKLAADCEGELDMLRRR